MRPSTRFVNLIGEEFKMGERRRAHGRGPQHSTNWGGARPRKKVEPVPDQVGKVKLSAAVPKEPATGFSPIAMARFIEVMNEVKAQRKTALPGPFFLRQDQMFAPAAIPKNAKLRLAMDEALTWAQNSWTAAYGEGLAQEGLAFLGYPTLAALAQRPEYRTFSETIATEMTRKWIEIKSVGGDEESDGSPDDETDPAGEVDPETAQDKAPLPETKGATRSGPPVEPDDADVEVKQPDKAKAEKDAKTEKIKELVEFLDDLKVRDIFADIARNDGFFGRSHLFLDIGDIDDKAFVAPSTQDPELATPIGNGRDDVTKSKVSKGNGLRRLQVVEPAWVYPTTYNASNPLAPDWYKPQVWYVMGAQVHHTRLLTFVGRPVPDMLKPAYAFGGLSLSQMVKPYVDIWLTTRQSVADLVKSFSTMVLSADMTTMLQPGGAAIAMLRAQLFNTMRDNNGLFLINKNTEEFTNVSAPISGLDALQSQAQEHMMSVARIPAVKFTGMSPQGLNASSEGEITVWYDTIAAMQNYLFRPHLTTVIDMAQITLWGEIDPEIVFDFVPLKEATEKELGEIRKNDSDRDVGYIDAGVLAPAEVRAKLASDPDSGYNDIEPDDVPEPPEPDLVGAESGGLFGGSKEPNDESDVAATEKA